MTQTMSVFGGGGCLVGRGVRAECPALRPGPPVSRRVGVSSIGRAGTRATAMPTPAGRRRGDLADDRRILGSGSLVVLHVGPVTCFPEPLARHAERCHAPLRRRSA